MSSILKNVVGRSVLVTGAASGLGEATARYLASQGLKVAVFDLDEAKGSKVAAEINGVFCKTDVASEESVKAAIAKAQEVNGPLFGAVNCAGIVLASKVLGKKGVHSLDQFSKVLNVNLAGTFNVCRLAAEQMSQQAAVEGEDKGIIINTASIAGIEGQIGQAAYSASKGGIIGLTLPLAREFASHKIRVNTIAPGIMMTPMMASLPQAAQDSLAKSVPYPQRLANPGEFAALVHHVMVNQYINGEVLRIDGSLRLGMP